MNNLRTGNAVCETKSSQSYERDRFNETIDSIFIDCKNLIMAKNADYTALNTQDPFFNFRQGSLDKFLRNENISKIDAMSMGILVRLNDKRRRRENLLLTGEREVYTENLEDTIKDEMNYLAILLTHLKMHGTNKDHVKQLEPERVDSKLDYILEENMRLSKQCSSLYAINNQLNSKLESLRVSGLVTEEAKLPKEEVNKINGKRSKSK